ncbi:hypothetical protein, partial [Stutzerimonas nitrititolerans]|uniref:hypothetical protein n=1 Tax=Stutzerimonas nitrititolerans TaxID=2482751 RepID=UPI0028A0089A
FHRLDCAVLNAGQSLPMHGKRSVVTDMALPDSIGAAQPASPAREQHTTTHTLWFENKVSSKSNL